MTEWTDEEIRLALKLHRHRSYRFVAEKMGREEDEVRAMICRLRQQMKCCAPDGDAARLATKKEILRLWRERIPLKDIAAQTRVSYYYAGTVVKNALHMREREFIAGLADAREGGEP